MSEFLLPTSERDWQKPPMSEEEAPLMTTIGLVSGDVLTTMEHDGTVTLKELAHELRHWPASLVTMAVGSLIRRGLVRGIQRGQEVVLQHISEEEAHAHHRIGPQAHAF